MPRKKLRPSLKLPSRRRQSNSGAGADIDLGELPFFIGYALRRAQVVVFQDFFRTFAELRIRPAQFSVLVIIERNPGLKQSEVASVLGIKRTNFVVLLNELERRGLAERRPAKGDRRSYALCLTEKGAVLLRRLKRMVAVHDRRVTAHLGAVDRKHLFRLLHQLADGSN
jgi:DNA-binding MarR family transcriptional regulator